MVIVWKLFDDANKVDVKKIEVREKYIQVLKEANKENWEAHKLLIEQNTLLYKILKGEKEEENE